MSAWQRPPPNYNRHNGVYGAHAHHAAPQVQQPVKLKRQASDLKSMYPVTRWCATYIDTKGSNASNDWADDNLDVTSPIPSTNVYLPMDLEQSILTQIEEYENGDKEIQEKLNKSKQEVEESKQQEESERNEKIETFMNFTSISDRNRAVKLLEQNEWDLQKAAAANFASSPDVTEGDPPGANANGHGAKAVIRLILPDNRQYTYQMDGNDTFWGVYGRLLQPVPELATKAFSLELSNGHILNENEFDQTLTHAQLVPRGDIRIKY